MKNYLLILLCSFLSIESISSQGRTRGFLSGDIQHLEMSNTFPKNLQPGIDYARGLVITKLKPEWRNALSGHRTNDAAIQTICIARSCKDSRPLYPTHKTRENAKVDLSLMYEFSFDPETNVPEVCRQLMASGRFEYAEPRFFVTTHGMNINKECLNQLVQPFDPRGFVPDDSLYGKQLIYFNQIGAQDAWEIEQGDTNVVIAIVDTGTDYLHPDLVNNVAYNYDDPVNGIDDDHNGYIDDFHGWDLANNDNDPGVPSSNGSLFHGTWTAGVAAASTNNKIGLASTAFKCRFMPVKGAPDESTDGFITNAYEGIVYAADNGAKVINCSWGGVAFAQYNQDIINYAVLDKDALVVCSVGNSGKDEELFPASYEYAMGVAGTDNADFKVDYSTYNHRVAISAPVMAICTNALNGYTDGLQGTSLAAPVVSGAAALVRSYFPELNALQTRERLRITADPIDSINPGLNEKIGNGRLNIYRALTDTNVRAVRITQIRFSDDNDQLFKSGDTIRIYGQIINYLDPVNSLECTITSPSSDITFLNDKISLGHMSTLESRSNETKPFTFIINENAKNEISIPLRLAFNDGTYTDWQWVTNLSRINGSYININNDRISTSVNSAGRFGIMYDNNEEGIGFHFNPADSIDFRMSALMIGNSASRVSDAAYNTYPAFEKDFKITDLIHADTNNKSADQVFTCTYNDSLNSIPSRMGLEVKQNIYLWDGDDYVISEYEITNKSNRTYNSIYVGLQDEIDIGISSYDKNRSDQDSLLHLGYIQSTVGTKVVAGTELLTPTPFLHYAMEWSSTYGGVDMTNGFTNVEKYLALSTQRPRSGFGTPGGADCEQVVSTGPLSLLPGGKVVVAFALLAGTDLEDIRNNAISAQQRYDAFSTTGRNELTVDTSLKVFPNPSNDEVQFSLGSNTVLSGGLAQVYNLNGQRLLQKAFAGHEGRIDLNTLSSGIYFLRIVNGNEIHQATIAKQ